MNIEERAAQAAAWKAAGQCNCAQAVLKAFEDRLPVDTDTLMKLGAGYAAGMVCKDLKGMETGAPLCPCPECVRNAVLALGEVLGE